MLTGGGGWGGVLNGQRRGHGRVGAGQGKGGGGDDESGNIL